MAKVAKKEKCGPDKEDVRSLYKRYLFWLFKTTKDELDRIDRKATQLDIDRDMLEIFCRDTAALASPMKDSVGAFVREWQDYINGKETDAQKLKQDDRGQILSSYYFLHLKQRAVLDITRKRFGAKAVKEFKRLYEEASMRTIAQDTSGRR